MAQSVENGGCTEAHARFTGRQLLDATLVFGREARVYLLGMDDMTEQLHEHGRGVSVLSGE